MKKMSWKITFFTILFLLIATIPNAQSGGLGLFVGRTADSDLSGNVVNNWEFDYEMMGGWFKFITYHDMQVKKRDLSLFRSAGLMYDSGIGADNLFSYRASLGYQNYNLSVPSGDIIHFEIERAKRHHNKFLYNLQQFKMESIGLYQTIKMNIIKIGPGQVWFGPQLQAAYTWGKSSQGEYTRLDWNKGAGAFNEEPGNYDPNYDKYSVTYYNLGIAPVLGVNFEVLGFLAPSISIGYQWVKSYYGKGRERFRDWTDAKIFAKENSLFINLALMFKVSGK